MGVATGLAGAATVGTAVGLAAVTADGVGEGALVGAMGTRSGPGLSTVGLGSLCGSAAVGSVDGEHPTILKTTNQRITTLGKEELLMFTNR